MTDLNDERWTRIRYDYEHTDRLIVDICAEHGISANTLRDRVRRWGWAKRRAPISREGPPAIAPLAGIALEPPLPACGERSASEASRVRGLSSDPQPAETPPHPDPLPASGEREKSGGAAPLAPFNTDTDPASIAPRLQGAVGRVLPAIEAIIARLASGPMPPREIEQTARALGTLTRTLRELNTLLAQQPLRAAEPYDDMPEDLDAFRNELARRIRFFVTSRCNETCEVPPPAATPAEP